MRSRFFVTILLVLLIVAVSSVFLYGWILKKERLALIDQQVRETAAALVDSEFNEVRKIDFDRVERVLSDELGETRIGKVFVIRNDKGDVLFESESAKILGVSQLPRDPQWITVRKKRKFIRLLNLKLPKVKDRTLQVGLVLDEDILSPSYLSLSSLLFFTIILALGSIVSLLLTSFLLKPIARLGGFLSLVSEQARGKLQLPNLPMDIVGKSAKLKNRDEFRQMVGGLNMLIDMVNKNYRLSRLLAYQVMHELKTPLSILKLQVEKLRTREIPKKEINAILDEGVRISETINSFLAWAELENVSSQTHLYANHMAATVRAIAERLESSYPGRICLDLQDDPVIVANPRHVEQLVTNLMTNALIYSNQPVTVRLANRALSFIDQGEGIPRDVIERLGEPFNRGNGSDYRGHGLGLAWAKSVCRLYSWEMGIFPSRSGSKIIISFPSMKESSPWDDAEA